ncbi:MAG: hypothetical protein HY681_13445 [Chloroflexi bacterium]|nr:hypothetical protein [Chloroflexota bacterium]
MPPYLAAKEPLRAQAQTDKDKALELGLDQKYVEQRSVAPSSPEARSRPTIYWWY